MYKPEIQSPLECHIVGAHDTASREAVWTIRQPCINGSMLLLLLFIPSKSILTPSPFPARTMARACCMNVVRYCGVPTIESIAADVKFVKHRTTFTPCAWAVLIILTTSAAAAGSPVYFGQPCVFPIDPSALTSPLKYAMVLTSR